MGISKANISLFKLVPYCSLLKLRLKIKITFKGVTSDNKQIITKWHTKTLLIIFYSTYIYIYIYIYIHINNTKIYAHTHIYSKRLRRIEIKRGVTKYIVN